MRTIYLIILRLDRKNQKITINLWAMRIREMIIVLGVISIHSHRYTISNIKVQIFKLKLSLIT